VTPRSRVVAFSCTGVLVVAGALCAALVGGLTGELLALVLISIGLGGALLLVFLEIGLGEERDLEREQERRRERERRRIVKRQRQWAPRWRRRPE
jgi:uncharacterized membrane protein